MRCPTCKKEIPDPRPGDELPKWFPFCSDRCKLIDIGRWADGKYQIPVAEEPSDQIDHAGRADLADPTDD